MACSAAALPDERKLATTRPQGSSPKMSSLLSRCGYEERGQELGALYVLIGCLPSSSPCASVHVRRWPAAPPQRMKSNGCGKSRIIGF
eukprot:COSAG06_NODE_2724_length_6384_cov_81.190135_5_plen_88_part_00